MSRLEYFAALYGEVAEVVKPKDFLFRPSDAQFRKTRDLVVEKYKVILLSKEPDIISECIS